MFYFSTLYKTKIRDKDDELVGRLWDMAIDLNVDKPYPPLLGILIETFPNKKLAFVEAKDILTWSTDGVVLKIDKKDINEKLPQGDNIFLLDKNIVDKQIVDLSGIRVVRVNDLQFGLVQGEMSLLAIDVSTSGLMRRLGFKKLILNLFKPNLLAWKDVHIVGGKLQLNIKKREINRLHPADIANIIEKLNLNQGSSLLSSLDEKIAARVMEEINPEIQKILIHHLGTERATKIMDKMSTDELVDLIQLLPNAESKHLIEDVIWQKNINNVKEVLKYDEDTAGGLMNTEFISAHLEESVGAVIEKIKLASPEHRSILFVYVVDSDHHHKGVVSLRRLLVADNNEIVKDVMKKVERTPVAKVDSDIKTVATLMTKYNLLSLAVVDDEKHLLGIITVDDVMRHFVPKA